MKNSSRSEPVQRHDAQGPQRPRCVRSHRRRSTPCPWCTSAHSHWHLYTHPHSMHTTCTHTPLIMRKQTADTVLSDGTCNKHNTLC